jgi:hypothetical protein
MKASCAEFHETVRTWRSHAVHIACALLLLLLLQDKAGWRQIPLSGTTVIIKSFFL